MKDRVFHFLSQEKLPIKTGDISKKLNIDRNTVQKILNDLYLEKKIILDKCYNKVLKVNKEEKNGR